MAKLTVQWWESKKPDLKSYRPDLMTCSPAEAKDWVLYANAEKVMVAALKSYDQQARAGAPVNDVADAALALTMSIGDLRNPMASLLASKKFKLKKFNKTLDDLVTAGNKALGSAQKPNKKLIQQWERDFGKAIGDLFSGVNGVNCPKMPITLSLYAYQVDLLVARGAQNSLISDLNAAFVKKVEEVEKEIASILKSFPGLVGRRTVKVYISRELIQTKGEELRKVIGSVPQKALDKIDRSSREAKEYKAEKAVSLTLKSLQFGAAFAGIFAPGTAPVAIVFALRASVALAAEIVTVISDLNAKRALVERGLTILNDSYKDARAEATDQVNKTVVAKETAKIIGNALIGTKFFTNLSKVKDDLDEMLGTLAVFRKRVTELEGELMPIIAELTKLQSERRKAKKNADNLEVFYVAFGGPRTEFKRYRLLEKQITRLERPLSKLVSKCASSQAQVRLVDDRLDKMKTALKELSQPPSTMKGLEHFETGLNVAIGLASAAGGAADSLIASVGTVNIAANTVSLANTVVETVDDLSG